jgi:hypothetical protein
MSLMVPSGTPASTKCDAELIASLKVVLADERPFLEVRDGKDVRDVSQGGVGFLNDFLSKTPAHSRTT